MEEQIGENLAEYPNEGSIWRRRSETILFRGGTGGRKPSRRLRFTLDGFRKR